MAFSFELKLAIFSELYGAISAGPEQLRISYPHTAAILEKLAECYWQESLYEQKRELLDFRG